MALRQFPRGHVWSGSRRICLNVFPRPPHLPPHLLMDAKERIWCFASPSFHSYIPFSCFSLLWAISEFSVEKKQKLEMCHRMFCPLRSGNLVSIRDNVSNNKTGGGIVRQNRLEVTGTIGVDSENILFGEQRALWASSIRESPGTERREKPELILEGPIAPAPSTQFTSVLGVQFLHLQRHHTSLKNHCQLNWIMCIRQLVLMYSMGLIMNRIIIIIFILAGVNPNKIYLCINQNVLKLFLITCVFKTWMLTPLIQSFGGACMVQSVENATLDLRFVSSRHVLSVEVLTKKYGLLRVEY